jgi:hypothetical protein
MSRLTRQFLRIPRPKSLFGIISLQTSAELICLALVFNKVTGAYGLLAILTGYQLSLLQLSTYLYSLSMLICLAYLIPHIRKQSPLECLALAWVYALDTIINAGYAALFGFDWCIGSAHSAAPSDIHNSVADATSGMVVEDVETLRPRPHVDVMPQETVASMIMVVSLTLLRIHFSLIVMAFARQTLQKYMQRVDMDAGREGPFAAGLPDGEGRRGRLGRAMVSVGRAYWLSGSVEDDDVSSKGWKDGSNGTLAGKV